MQINLRPAAGLAGVLLIVSVPSALAHTDVTVGQAQDLIRFGRKDTLLIVCIDPGHTEPVAIATIPRNHIVSISSGVYLPESCSVHGQIYAVRHHCCLCVYGGLPEKSNLMVVIRIPCL